MSTISNFISSIQDKHLENYSSFQKAKMVERIATDKAYMSRFLIKKAKHEFVADLMQQVARSSKPQQWKQTQLQFLQRVQETLRMSMHAEVTFAMQDKSRYDAKQEEKRKNTWV